MSGHPIETMLTETQADRRTAAIAATTVVAALAMQFAIVAGAAFSGGSSSYNGDMSVLLDSRHSFTDLAVIAGTNCAWLLAIAMLAWPIARLWSWSIHDTWDHPNVNIAARFLYPLVAVVLLAILGWVFSEQALALDAHLSSHWALLTTLIHGTLEFSALLLPLVAAASCIFLPAEKPGRLLLGALAVALPLVLCGAFVEVYLTPYLLDPYLI